MLPCAQGTHGATPPLPDTPAKHVHSELPAEELENGAQGLHSAAYTSALNLPASQDFADNDESDVNNLERRTSIPAKQIDRLKGLIQHIHMESCHKSTCTWHSKAPHFQVQLGGHHGEEPMMANIDNGGDGSNSAHPEVIESTSSKPDIGKIRKRLERLCRESATQLADVEKIVQIMQEREDYKEVQELVCGTFAELSRQRENKIPIAEAGAIEAVIGAMRKYPDSKGVQESSCWVLRNLAHVEGNKKRIAAADGIKALIIAMKKHPQWKGVQEGTAGALRHLALKSDANSKCIARAGGIEALIQAMVKNNGVKGIQDAGCGALKNLSRGNKRSIQRIVDSEGIEAILAICADKDHTDL